MSVMLKESTVVNSTNYKLLPAKQYHTSRNGKIKGAVVHVTAGLQDLGMTGTDESAEGTNKWAINSGVVASWCRIADTDGVESCLPSWYVAYQAKGYNTHTVGNEISNLDARWDNKSALWVKWTIWHAARSYADLVIKYKIPLKHVTKAELDHAIAVDGPPVGFIDHSRLSPIRRDPGATFPWALFFKYITQVHNGYLQPDVRPTTIPVPVPVPAAHKEAPDMVFYRLNSKDRLLSAPVLASDGFQVRWLNPNGWAAIRASVKQQTGVTPEAVLVNSLDGVAVTWVGPVPTANYPIPPSMKRV